MPPPVKSFRVKLRDAIKGHNCLQLDGQGDSSIVFCNPCEKSLKIRPKNEANSIAEHLKSVGHKANVDSAKSGQTQPSIVSSLISKSPAYKLANMMVKCDIPLYKLTNTIFRNYWEDAFKKEMPSRAACLREVENIYKDVMNRIRQAIGNSDIYMILDETTDAKESKVVNVLVGVIDGKEHKSMLCNQEIVQTANAIEIGKVFLRTLNYLFPGQEFYDRVKFVITDAAPYMICCFKNQKAALFKNLVHITCIVHMLHRVAEDVKQNCGTLDKFIGKIKAVLLKSRSRQNRFKEETGLLLPPKAIITRWGSWLTVSLYYLDNWEIVFKFLEKLIAEKIDKSVHLEQIASILNSTSKYKLLKDQMLSIETFRNIPDIIASLENPKLTVTEQLAKLDAAESEISSSLTARNKYIKLVNKNIGLRVMREMQSDLVKVLQYKFVPLTSVDVERSFSQYKAFLRPNRHSFIEENIKFHTIISYNNFM